MGEVNVFLSSSPLRILLPREPETLSSLDSKWEETSQFLLTVPVFSLTPRDEVEPLDTIWLSLFLVFNLEGRVMTSFSRKTTRHSMSPPDVSKWKLTRKNKKLEEYSSPLSSVIPIWDPRYPRRSSPRVSSTLALSKFIV